MKRLTTIILMTGAIVCFATAVLFATVAAAQESDTEALRMLAAGQAELVEVERVLADPAAKGRQGAIHTLVHLASGYSVLPDEVRILLIRATGDSDPRIALLAKQALFNIDHRRPDPDAEVPESVRIERSRQRDFEQARAILTGSRPDSGDRFGAIQTLVHLASAAPALSEEVVRLLEELRSSPDLEIAYFAESTLADREGRAMDAAFVQPAAPSPETADDRFSDEPDRFAGLRAERPSARLAALELILDSALSEDRRDDLKVIGALVRMLDDPDSRVAYRAGNALAALAGDDNALADVYVGESVDDPAISKSWPETLPDDLVAPPNLGYIDEHGVFIGIVKERPRPTEVDRKIRFEIDG